MVTNASYSKYRLDRRGNAGFFRIPACGDLGDGHNDDHYQKDDQAPQRLSAMPPAAAFEEKLSYHALSSFLLNDRASTDGAGRHRAKAILDPIKPVLFQYTCGDNRPLPASAKCGHRHIPGHLIQFLRQFTEKNVQ
jgi:hypothetical protein